MKSLLTKIFSSVSGGETGDGGAPQGASSEHKQQHAPETQPSIPERPEQEVLPSAQAEPKPKAVVPMPMLSLRDHQKRALIGWAAEKLARQLHVNWQPGAQFQCFMTEAPQLDDVGDESLCLLHIAARLAEAVENQEDVYMTIREMKLTDKQHRLLLELYEEFKVDFRLYLTSKRTEEPSRQDEEGETWQIYRDVIYAATQMKFLLIRCSEVEQFRQGKLLCEAVIKERGDIPKARDAAKTSLLGQGLSQTAVMSQLLVISEAVTNILKHANDGLLTIVKAEAAIHILVQDRGPGFPLKLLPNTTLIAGYSTKNSLGQGFTLMMKMADRVLLSTSSKGSTLILIFNEKGSRNLHEHNE